MVSELPGEQTERQSQHAGRDESDIPVRGLWPAQCHERLASGPQRAASAACNQAREQRRAGKGKHEKGNHRSRNALPGDSMEVLPTLPKVDAVITDPPWDRLPRTVRQMHERLDWDAATPDEPFWRRLQRRRRCCCGGRKLFRPPLRNAFSRLGTTVR